MGHCALRQKEMRFPQRALLHVLQCTVWPTYDARIQSINASIINLWTWVIGVCRCVCLYIYNIYIYIYTVYLIICRTIISINLLCLVRNHSQNIPRFENKSYASFLFCFSPLLSLFATVPSAKLSCIYRATVCSVLATCAVIASMIFVGIINTRKQLLSLQSCEKMINTVRRSDCVWLLAYFLNTLNQIQWCTCLRLVFLSSSD